jgi:hypothetical protein
VHDVPAVIRGVVMESEDMRLTGILAIWRRQRGMWWDAESW